MGPARPDMCALSVEGTPRGGEGTGEGSNEDDGMQLGQASLTAEQGLKHLLLTVDVERLYRQVPGLRCLTNLTANPSSGMSYWLVTKSSDRVHGTLLKIDQHPADAQSETHLLTILASDCLLPS